MTATFQPLGSSNPQFPFKERALMQVVANSRFTWRTLLLVGAVGSVGSRLEAQKPEQYTIRGDEVGIYNLAGEVRIEPGPGPAVTAELTRGGADAAKLK